MGSDQEIYAGGGLDAEFQSTLPHGERPDHATVENHQQISIHAPAWGATCWDKFDTPSPSGQISIHAPAWGATIPCIAFPPRLGISIHAPAWGATHQVIPVYRKDIISIHAPAWGATPAAAPNLPNPLISIHAPAWGATIAVAGCTRIDTISIHAPAWGATWTAQFKRQQVRISIHAPAWGATTAKLAAKAVTKEFQSTLPHGERPSSARSSWSRRRNFNPRSRMGSDQRTAVRVHRLEISIHAPAWGATVRRHHHLP